MTQWQQRTSNVVLTFPIDGIERMSDPFLQTIVLQVAMEIVGCEAQNLGIRAVVIEADGCVLLRVFGLSRIVAKVCSVLFFCKNIKFLPNRTLHTSSGA